MLPYYRLLLGGGSTRVIVVVVVVAAVAAGMGSLDYWPKTLGAARIHPLDARFHIWLLQDFMAIATSFLAPSPKPLKAHQSTSARTGCCRKDTVCSIGPPCRRGFAPIDLRGSHHMVVSQNKGTPI